MPGVMIARPKMTRSTYQALKRYILKEREKIKQEEEEDKAMEQRLKEREQEKKRKEEESLTLEQTKEQIMTLEKKLEALKGEKHELFHQLKKVLHMEDEVRKRAQMKEQSELLTMNQYSQPPHGALPAPPAAHPSLSTSNLPSSSGSAHQMYIPSAHGIGSGRPTMRSVNPLPPQGVKRQRSPSPPPPSLYYNAGIKGSAYGAVSSKPDSFHHNKQGSTYNSQNSASFSSHSSGNHGNQQSPISKYVMGANQPGYQMQVKFGQKKSDSYAQHGFRQKILQQTYQNQGHNVGVSQQQPQSSVDHSSAKHHPYKEEPYKMQQIGMRGGVVSASHPAQNMPTKGGIMSGYPIRTQNSSSSYQSNPSFSGAQQSANPRHTYKW